MPGRPSAVVRDQRDAVVDTADDPKQMMQARKDALKQMTPALRDKFTKITKFYEDQIDATLTFYYRLGHMIREIKADEKTYGKDGPELLRIASATRWEIFRKAQYFAEGYTEAEFKKFLARRNRQDVTYRLTFGHMTCLLACDSKKERLQFETQATSGLWTPAMLREQIQLRHGGPRSSGGRPMGRPSTLQGGIKQMKDVTGLWNRRNQEVWRGEQDDVFAKLLNLPPEKYTEAMLGDVQTVRASMAQMHEASKLNVEAAGRVVEHMEASLKARSNKARGNKARKRIPVSEIRAADAKREADKK